MPWHFDVEPLSAFRTFRYAVAGDVLTINGQAYDLSPLAEGGTLPQGAIAAPWLLSDVTRVGGLLSLRVVAAGMAEAPASLDVAEDGALALPDEGWPEWELLGAAIDWTQVQTEAGQEDAALAAWRAKATAPKHVFATACLMAGYLSEEQAEDWVRGAALPDFVHDALLPLATPMARTAARITIWASDTIHRSDTLVGLLQQNRTLTDAQVDDLFPGAPTA